MIVSSAASNALANNHQPFKLHTVNIHYVWPHNLATDDAFDVGGNLGAGYELMLTPQVGIGVSWSFSRWHDYLGMFCGKYTFTVHRPALDLSYYFNRKDTHRVVPFGTLSLCYNRIGVTNELCNPYDGDVKSHFSLIPGLGINLVLWQLRSGPRILLVFRFSYPLNGPFNHPSGFWGLGCQF